MKPKYIRSILASLLIDVACQDKKKRRSRQRHQGMDAKGNPFSKE